MKVAEEGKEKIRQEREKEREKVPFLRTYEALSGDT